MMFHFYAREITFRQFPSYALFHVYTSLHFLKFQRVFKQKIDISQLCTNSSCHDFYITTDETLPGNIYLYCCVNKEFKLQF